MTQNLKFNLVRKDRLFYNQYQYAVTFYMPEVSILKVLDHAEIDLGLDRREQWRQGARQRLISGNHALPWNRSWQWPMITPEIRHAVHELCDFLLQAPVPFKLVTTVNQAWIYTNEVSLLHSFDVFVTDCVKTYSEAVIDRPQDTVMLRHSEHQHRAYLKNARLTVTQCDHLANFLQQQSQHVRLSPALARWVECQNSTKICDYYFVDHANHSWATMLNLVCPGLIRKTVQIITDK